MLEVAQVTEAPTAHCIGAGCGRKLTNTVSVGRRMGPTCYAKAIATAKVADLTEYVNQKKAREMLLDLIELGGLIPQETPGLYSAVSKTDPEVSYEVDTLEQTCECKAHGRYGYCSHLTAANVLEANRVIRGARPALALAA